MLDNVTKRRIDTARDILVGKVPDPKSQVEQITIALIYKFMDDMDAQAEEMGGKRSFFAGEYEKYGWAKLMSLGKGGHEVLNLYGEAITTMNRNEGIPPLFRDIFKNAYLPYRDPETLKSFLKIINDFEYDHSERLGDAFEYLLSVLGSQGDAGQFRTPRHIIDFMVEVIDPKKEESILDPACGTAGFLISSWKHILQANSKDGRKGAGLTPDERKRLTKNIKGYDISPDMVRLSLVNLYLHGFTDPHISEYDTLTSEDNWNQYSDIIMANPPFMSPKGGIKPHKRFSVQAKRSEVLFVDYIAEHLTPNGRAAVIVPEGIIFQSQNAYKQLRKMLVENYLYAVVSMPAGIFQPYSGVKTSILLMDKTLAKNGDSILFVKIENDGFDLGAQRRQKEGTELPEAVKIIKDYVQAVTAGRHSRENGNPDWTPDQAGCDKIHLVVPKEKIGENGEWNLSGERYRESGELKNTSYELVELGEVCEFQYGKPLKKDDRVSGEFPVYGSNGIVGYHNDYLVEAPFIIIGRKGSAGEVTYSKYSGYPIDTTFYVKFQDEKEITLKYLYFLLKEGLLKNLNTQAGVPGLNRNDAYKVKIPLPPLKIQQEIVAEIEGYQKIIDGARAVVENYKPQIQIDPEWEMVKLGGTCENLDGKRVPITKSDRKSGQYPYYGASGIVDYVDNYIFNENLLLISEDGANLRARVTPIAFSVSGKLWVNNHAHVLRFEHIETQKFVELYINSISIENYVTGAAQPKLNQKALNSIKIPLPPLTTQTEIVAQIEKEQSLVNVNKELITLFEQKIKDKIASVWGEDK